MISPRHSPLALATWIALWLPGCVIDVDLSNKQCPCIDGWVCDESRDVCVLDGLADGGSGDAGDGPRDAGGPDARVSNDSGPPPATCETVRDAIFCEDFETGDLRRWDSIAPSAGGSISPSPSAAHAGGRGLRMTTPGFAMASGLSATIDSGAATDLYFRAWVRVTDLRAGPIDLFSLEVTGAGTITAQMIPGNESFVVRVAAPGASEISDSGRNGRWTLGEWTCVEGRVVRGEGTGSVEIVDAPPQAAALSGIDTEWGAPFGRFSIRLTPSVWGGEVELDDVMWTTTRSSCP